MRSLGAIEEGENFFDEKSIEKALTDVFKKFDTDGNGWLGFTEFARAWGELGLGNREDEIMRAYYKVDTDRSGSITLEEFMAAIQGEKMDELNMNLLFTKLGRSLGVKWKSMVSKGDRFKSFQATAQRRRMMKKQMEEDMEKNMREILQSLCGMLKGKIHSCSKISVS
jgi:Ca2+-binding EF-hand superfamily protein